MRDRKFMTPAEAGILAALVLGLTIWLLLPKGAGTEAVVAVGGDTVGRYPLNSEVRVPVSGAHGFHLTLVVQGGRAYVEESTCPDLICQHHAPVSKAGEVIVCLPGQVTITVEGGERHGPDAIVG